MLHPKLANFVIHVQLVVTGRCFAQEAMCCTTLGFQMSRPHPCNCTAKPWKEGWVGRILELLDSSWALVVHSLIFWNSEYFHSVKKSTIEIHGRPSSDTTEKQKTL